MLLPLLIGSALGVGFLLSEGHFAQIGVFFAQSVIMGRRVCICRCLVVARGLG